MTFIYVTFRDNVRTLWRVIKDPNFNVQQWANDNAKNFKLLDIVHISYEVVELN